MAQGTRDMAHIPLATRLNPKDIRLAPAAPKSTGRYPIMEQAAKITVLTVSSSSEDRGFAHGDIHTFLLAAFSSHLRRRSDLHS
jgi:hypothetical protein